MEIDRDQTEKVDLRSFVLLFAKSIVVGLITLTASIIVGIFADIFYTSTHGGFTTAPSGYNIIESVIVGLPCLILAFFAARLPIGPEENWINSKTGRNASICLNLVLMAIAIFWVDWSN